MSPREPKPTLTATYTYLRRRRAGPAAYPAPARLTPTRSHLGRSRTSGGAAAAAVLMVPLAPVPGSRTRPNGRSRRRCGRPGSRGHVPTSVREIGGAESLERLLGGPGRAGGGPAVPHGHLRVNQGARNPRGVHIWVLERRTPADRPYKIYRKLGDLARSYLRFPSYL